MRICFFTKHEITWGSSRERIGVYLEYIKNKEHSYKIIHCIPNRLSRYWIGGQTRNSLTKTIYSFWYSRILKHLKLLWIITTAKKYDKILIQKLNLHPLLLRILRIRNENILFDFDDQCFWDIKTFLGKKISLFKRLSFWRRGLQNPIILKQYSHVIAGSQYLADLAKEIKGNNGVSIFPTVIDCHLYKPQNGKNLNSTIVIGWSGTGENHLRHLRLLTEPLKAIREKYDFVFKLVGAMHSKRIKSLFEFLGTRFICIDWVRPDMLPEIIQTFDIGVMPLNDDDEARAKCGFKLLAYMASGVSSIASPVGVNKEIIKDGINGFLAKEQNNWVNRMSLLICDENLRKGLAKEARKTVEETYSLDKTSCHFVKLLER
jgi:glycosyltransferase involved in cell wall biosynthesis